MQSPYASNTEKLLGPGFPVQVIRVHHLSCIAPIHESRLKTELIVSGIEGLTWPQITAAQARGTWDILHMMVPQSVAVVLPGYLQWLWDIEEADVMVHALPSVLMKMSHDFGASRSETLSLPFVIGIHNLFVELHKNATSLGHTEEVATWEPLITRYGDLEKQLRDGRLSL